MSQTFEKLLFTFWISVGSKQSQAGIFFKWFGFCFINGVPLKIFYQTEEQEQLTLRPDGPFLNKTRKNLEIAVVFVVVTVF